MPDLVTHLNAALEGCYRIERELGEGGMATVYLADDLRHERKVALKVLKPELAAVVGAERFLAEIKTTANLQHPNILPLFDSGEADGFLFYVMPYVEGESLRERLEREKQLPVDEAVRIAEDVAEALHAAHEQGVIHRDVKPANILLSGGRPLIADFGIAFAVSAAGGGRLTETGLSMGTPFYMSPEQASADREPTSASDVYSLGCVLYEALTGEPPYVGSTAQAVLARILQGGSVSVTELRSSVPANVEAAIRKALERLPADRFRSALDLSKALSDQRFRYGLPPTGADDVPSAGWKAAAVAGWAVASVLAAALAAVLTRPAQEVGRDVSIRASLAPFVLRAPAGTGELVEISPDGSWIVAKTHEGGVSRLLIRGSDELEFRDMPAEVLNSGGHPTFSPDSRLLLVDGPGGVRVIDLESGIVDNVAAGSHPHWGANGIADNGLYHMADISSSPTLLLESDSVGRPHLLPNGRGVLYQLGGDISTRRLGVLDLRSRERTEFDILGNNPQYVPTGHVVFGDQDQQLMAVPFDIEELRPSGSPFLVAGDVLVFNGGATQFTVSDNGIAIVGGTSPVEAGQQLSLVRTDGTVSSLPVRGNLSTPRFSPDGRRIAYESDLVIRVFDRVTGTDMALTEGRNARTPTWAPDGQSVRFFLNSGESGGGGWAVYDAPLADKQAARILFHYQGAASSHLLFGSTPDDSMHLLQLVSIDRGADLAAFTGGDSPTDYLRARWDESSGALSPNGRWVAYVSTETGRPEVYVRSFPEPGPRIDVSVDGGVEPLWSPEGDAVYFRALSSEEVLRAELSLTGTPVVSPPSRVVADVWHRASSGFPARRWDMARDGELVFVGGSDSGGDLPIVPLQLIVNFFDLLEERDPN
jgi:Tol biopolymer transport system component